MPASVPRKSSLGGRRNIQKAHIPYRGDNPEVGKKTGVAIRVVERKSDGFEPFEELMSQADKRTPPKLYARKRNQSFVPVTPFRDLDEDGELSMELDSPLSRRVMHAPPPVSPTSYQSSALSARLVSRTSDIDFDEIPSPRSGRSRKSFGHRFSTGPGPSRLSEHFNAPDVAEVEDYPTEQYAPSPERPSFAQMDQDDDDDDDMDNGDVNGGTHQAPEEDAQNEETPSPSPPLAKGKGKGKAKLSIVHEEPEPHLEDEIAEGLADIQEEYSDEDAGQLAREKESPEPSPPRRKKARVSIEEPRAPRVKSRSKSKKENRPVREGVRKSTRQHYPPLEWWRGEKLVYGRPEGQQSSGPLLVAPIKEIMRIPKEPPVPLGKRKRSVFGHARSKASEEVRVVHTENPEEGWDSATPTHCTVLDFLTKEEVARRVTITAAKINPKQVGNDDWAFDKVFWDADFVAAGILVIPPHGRKPSKQTKDNTYIFYVLSGAVNLKLHHTSMILATGAVFLVPRGNTYFIENIADRDAKLFFTQARKVPVELMEGIARPQSARSLSRGTSNAPAPIEAEDQPAGTKKAESKRAATADGRAASKQLGKNRAGSSVV